VTPRSRIERIQSRATEGFRLTTEEFTRFLDEACRETQQAVCEALSNHNRVLVEHGAGEAGDDDPLELPNGGYASTCAERSLSPLGGELARLDLGESIRVHWEACCAGLVAVAEALPVDVVRSSAESASGVEPVPVRVIAAYYARERLPVVIAPFVGERLAMLGRWVHHVECGASRWWEAVRQGASAPSADLLSDWSKVADAEWTPLSELIMVELAEAFSACERDLSGDSIEGDAYPDRVAVGAPWSSIDPSARWVEWHREAVARLTLECALVGCRADLYRLCASHVDGLEAALTELSSNVSEAADGLEVRGSNFVSRLEQGRATGLALGEVVAEEELLLDAFEGGVLAEVVTFCTGPASPRARGDELGDRVSRLIGRQTDALVVHRLAEGDRPELGSGRITFEFRRAIAQCIDAFMVERLRYASHNVLAQPLFEVRTLLETIPGIVESGFKTLETEIEAGRDLDAEVVAMVPEMVTRIRAVAAEATQILDEAAEPIRSDIAESLEGSWNRLVERSTLTSEVRAQLAGVRSSLALVTKATAQDAWIGMERSFHRTRRIWSLRLTRWSRWLRSLSSTDVGIETIRRSDTLALLQEAPERLERLPLVYRHLFTPAPVREPGLFVGRADLLARVLAAAHTPGRHRPLLIVADPGVGMSSIFAALESGKLGSRIRRVTLRERVLNDAELVSSFLAAGIDGHGYGLDALPEAVLSGSDTREGTPLILMEGLEQAFFRRVGGSSLVVSFLSTIADAGAEVDWVVGISAAAWQVVSLYSPYAAAGWDVRTLSALGREELEAAVWIRHQRSGIPISFEAPRDAGRWLTRRLRLAADDDDRQEILKEVYFDDLHRETNGSLSLSLLLWLEGLKLEEGSDATMRFPTEVESGFLEGLDLDQTFALKAFLEHGSLTHGELAEVLRVKDADAARILAALERLQLLAPVPDELRGGLGLKMDRPRLQLSRPAISLVIRLLENRNILH